MSRTGLLVVAFFLGLCIDIFENSGGIHASASVMMAYFRPLTLKIVSRRQDADIEDMKISNFGFLSMFIYTLLGTTIHHFTLFILESFSLSNFGTVLLRTFYSTIFTLTFVLIVQLWNFRSRKS